MVANTDDDYDDNINIDDSNSSNLKVKSGSFVREYLLYLT
jgi:hypothetical protein